MFQFPIQIVESSAASSNKRAVIEEIEDRTLPAHPQQRVESVSYVNGYSVICSKKSEFCLGLRQSSPEEQVNVGSFFLLPQDAKGKFDLSKMQAKIARSGCY
jgi:hypothetical protein